MVTLIATFVDMCVDSCCTFIGTYRQLFNCPVCNKLHYINQGTQQKAHKKATYFSLKDYFKI